MHLMPKHQNFAALATLLTVLALVIVPLTLTAASLVEEAADIHQSMQADKWTPGEFFQEFVAVLPCWAADLLDRLGLKDVAAVEAKLSDALVKRGSFFASEALDIGLGTINFIVSFAIMLYLLYFFVRDGDALARRITHVIPLPPEQQHALVVKSTIVIRATFKGNLLVAAVQGALGGFIFWLLGINAPVLWAVVMALCSLLPAVGAAIVWFPVAVYFLATGSVWQGVVLMAYGVGVMGLIDNLLRPLLVGKETEMPDYLVLISTLGGIAAFGLSGFVIGPLVAALFIAVWDIFSRSRQTAHDQGAD
jgi:predicted PurR-regulated permease PerM